MLFAYKETFTLLSFPANHTMTRHGECITVDGLPKSYDGTKAVDGISFLVERGTVFGFLDPKNLYQVLQFYQLENRFYEILIRSFDTGTDNLNIQDVMKRLQLYCRVDHVEVIVVDGASSNVGAVRGTAEHRTSRRLLQGPYTVNHYMVAWENVNFVENF